ncbi:MAG: dTDP-4-dehydrorhamnose 3,5-epimerase [Patescibacteria group bacterium]|nr:dTDP-4-dehydrorhamnose 3,5-epimerase [Patescibacteria group bacterium]
MANFNTKVNILNKLYHQGDISINEYKQILRIDEERARDFLGEKDKDLFLNTTLFDVLLIKPRIFFDERGFFLESYSEIKYIEAGIGDKFVQDNHSLSAQTGVLRGFHWQRPPYTQSKLVRALKGSVYDVVVDLRKKSPTYKQWEIFKLSEQNKLLLYIPKGFAHAFCTLEPNTEFFYKVDAIYSPEHEDGFKWNDPDITIKWPFKNPIISDKDDKLLNFKDINNPF